MSALGDVFMALPHVDVILNHHRKHRIWLLTSPLFAGLFLNRPRVQTAVLDRHRWLHINSTLCRIAWVRRQNFAAIYDLQGNRISRLIVRFSGCPKRVGTQPKRVYNFHPETPYTKATQQNVFDRLNETLAASGLPQATPGCKLYPSKRDDAHVFEWKRQNGIEDRNYALMHAGSSENWLSKRWPKDRFAELAVIVEKTGIRCIWIGSNADREVNGYLAQFAGIDATEQFSILQLYILGKAALFAVTNDSGPMHIFATTGIPVYGFFGPTSWIRSHAAGQKDRVFTRDVDCSPCFLSTCPTSKHHACFDGIDPETVFSKIRQDVNFGENIAKENRSF
jgi:ADP-heptose:LPS heptosyltransferase